jgi:transcriptional regulator with XRE-family HTH domain
MTTATLGARVRRLRKRKKMTILALAYASNLSPTFISDLEREVQRNVTMVTLCKVANALEAKPENLIKGIALSFFEGTPRSSAAAKR